MTSVIEWDLASSVHFLLVSSWIHFWFCYMPGTDNTNLYGVSVKPYVLPVEAYFFISIFVKIKLPVRDNWLNFYHLCHFGFSLLYHGSEGAGHEKVDFARQRERCSLEHWVSLRKMWGTRQDPIMVLQTVRSARGRDHKRKLPSSWQDRRVLPTFAEGEQSNRLLIVGETHNLIIS